MIDKDSLKSTEVCIIGGGPAGVISAYLFALQGISVVLIEGQKDFDRSFRGDTLHASSLEILEQLGLVDEVLALSSSRIDKLSIVFSDAELSIAEFSAMDSSYPYVALIPQEKFLNLIVEKAKLLPDFTLLMAAQMRELIEENGRISGVRYNHAGNDHEIRSALTIGADGRGSTVRQLANIVLSKTSPPMDVLWFKVPMPRGNVSEDVNGRIGSGQMIVIINRQDYLQVGYIIMKGDYRRLREQGIEHFHEIIKQLAPELSDVISEIHDWSQIAILSVVTGRAEQWYKEGLLLIGDAAHVMSPVGGVGINYAIQDAVAAVNLLAEPIRKERLIVSDLKNVQLRREPAIALIQRFQALIQNRIIKGALKSEQAFSPPLPMKILTKIPFVRKKIAQFLAYGSRHEIIQNGGVGKI